MEAAPQQQASSTKRVPGRPFKPGQSGNPAGRKAKSPALRELERVTREQATVALERLAGPALRVLQKALQGRDQALAVRAAVDVLDRTQGKALQRVEGHISAEQTVTVTPEMLRMAATRLLAAQAQDVEEVQAGTALLDPREHQDVHAALLVQPDEVDRP